MIINHKIDNNNNNNFPNKNNRFLQIIRDKRLFE